LQRDRLTNADFIATGMAGRQSIRQALAEIGFTEEQRYFRHPETEYFVEFPSGPLAIGDEPPGEIASRTYPTGVLRLLSPTDSVKDRLAAYFHWKDRQSLEQAMLVAAGHSVAISAHHSIHCDSSHNRVRDGLRQN